MSQIPCLLEGNVNCFAFLCQKLKDQERGTSKKIDSASVDSVPPIFPSTGHCETQSTCPLLVSNIYKDLEHLKILSVSFSTKSRQNLDKIACKI